MNSSGTRLIFTTFFATLCFVSPGFAQRVENQPSVQLPAELDRVLRDYETAWRNRDPAALAALFHSDGFVLSSGSGPVRGRVAIQKHYTGHGGALQLRAIGYATQDTVGYIIGMFAGSAGHEVGKFVLALRRSDKHAPWLIAADMDNPNQR